MAKLEAELKAQHEKELARFASKPGGGDDDGKSKSRSFGWSFFVVFLGGGIKHVTSAMD